MHSCIGLLVPYQDQAALMQSVIRSRMLLARDYNCALDMAGLLLPLLPCAVRLTQFGGVDLDPATSALWFAGKQLMPEKPLAEYMGRNERTRATVKLQKKGQGAPSREPVRITCITFTTHVSNVPCQQ